MFRFSIREILLITVLAAVALGWFVDRRQLSARFEDKPDRLGKFLDNEIELHLQRDIAHTMESQANDCWQSLQSERQQNEMLQAQIRELQGDLTHP